MQSVAVIDPDAGLVGLGALYDGRQRDLLARFRRRQFRVLNGAATRIGLAATEDRRARQGFEGAVGEGGE